MIEQQATVVEVLDETVVLAAQRQSTCSQCKVKQGCGSGLLADHIGERFTQISVNKTQATTLGQQVTLGIPEQALLNNTALMYLLPLAAMLIFAITASQLGAGEGFQSLSGGLGLMTGLVITKWCLNRKKIDLQVKVNEE